MELARELRPSLQDFLAGATIEIRENGSRITATAPLSWEVRDEEAKPLLHLWADNCNVTRRVLAIADQSEARLALAVERFGRTNPSVLKWCAWILHAPPKNFLTMNSLTACGASWRSNFLTMSSKKSLILPILAIRFRACMRAESPGVVPPPARFSPCRTQNQPIPWKAAWPMRCYGLIVLANPPAVPESLPSA